MRCIWVAALAAAGLVGCTVAFEPAACVGADAGAGADAGPTDAAIDGGGSSDAGIPCSGLDCPPPCNDLDCANSLNISLGEGQSVPYGKLAAAPLVAFLGTRGGGTMNDYPVRFVVTAGNATVVKDLVLTDYFGHATTFAIGGSSPSTIAARAWAQDGTLLETVFHVQPGGSTPIFRSLQSGAGLPLAAGSSFGALSISGRLATFANALPDDVGVGDAIQYSSSGGAVDSLAFIVGRLSDHECAVQSADGGAPAAAAAHTSWQLARAFLGIDDALTHVVNPGIAPALRGFDAVMAGDDLGAAGLQWNLSCYAGLDSQSATVQWTTTAPSNLRIFTPVEPWEVGASQRHKGTWASGGYRNDGGLTVSANFVRLDGLALQVSGNVPVVAVWGVVGQGEVSVSNCYSEYADPALVRRPFELDNPGASDLLLKMWNNIALTRSSDPGSFAIWLESSNATTRLYAYNNTGASNAGGCLFVGSGAVFLRNQLCQGGGLEGTFAAVDHSATSDGTAGTYPGQGNVANAVFSFVDAAGGDYHLASSDTAARGNGADLSSDPIIAFTDDIDGDWRSPWDIGAD